MENTATKIDVLESTNYFFILKELENLVNCTSESDIIKEVFELLNKFFAPRQIVFIDYSQNKSGESTYYHSIDKVINQIDANDSFILEIVHRDELLGVFEIYGVRLPEYIDEYRKIGAVVCSICRAALINTRKYAIIQSQKEQLQIYSNHLNEMIHTKDKFFSIISHDLRSPLSSFMGLTKILNDEFDEISFKDIRQMTAKMKDAATGIFGLLENLLEWSRSQQGLITCNLKKLDVDSVVKDIVKIYKADEIKKDIKISCNIPLGLSVYADFKMLQTILRNLVCNALKFTHKGGEIVISAQKMEEDVVRISIRDTGIGIPDKLLNSLFVVKVKTNRYGTEGESSAGLGLILCKDFVEKHGGRFRVESEEGKGTTFSFTLPANKQVVPIKN